MMLQVRADVPTEALMHAWTHAGRSTQSLWAADEQVTASIRARYAPSVRDGVQRIYFFFSANRTVAPDHFVQWWSSNDSVYESDNKKREGNRLFWRCSHSFVDYKQFCFFFPFLLLRSHGQIRFCCGMSFVCLFLYIWVAATLLYWF